MIGTQSLNSRYGLDVGERGIVIVLPGGNSGRCRGVGPQSGGALKEVFGVDLRELIVWRRAGVEAAQRIGGGNGIDGGAVVGCDLFEKWSGIILADLEHSAFLRVRSAEDGYAGDEPLCASFGCIDEEGSVVEYWAELQTLLFIDGFDSRRVCCANTGQVAAIARRAIQRCSELTPSFVGQRARLRPERGLATL